MKVCPVCKSNVFDDMDTCYNCLHKFDEEDEMREKQEDLVSEKDQETCQNGSAFDFADYIKAYSSFLNEYIKCRNF